MKQTIQKCAFCGKSRYRLFWHRNISEYNIIIKGDFINNERIFSHTGDTYAICDSCIINKFNFKMAACILPITTKIKQIREINAT